MRPPPRLPVWMWILGGFVMLRILSGLGLNLLAILVVGYVAWVVIGGSRGHRRPMSGPARPGSAEAGWLPPPADGHPAPPAGPQPAGPPPAGSPPAGPPPSGAPMPTIDVPRYPGSAGGGSQRRAGTPPDLPRPPEPTGPTGSTGTSSVGSDPAVSLVQLLLAEAGRELETAAAGGDRGRVDAALARLEVVIGRAQESLSATGSAPAARLRSRLEDLRGDVRRALGAGEGPERSALVSGITAACRTVGQTGAHD